MVEISHFIKARYILFEGTVSLLTILQGIRWKSLVAPEVGIKGTRGTCHSPIFTYFWQQCRKEGAVVSSPSCNLKGALPPALLIFGNKSIEGLLFCCKTVEKLLVHKISGSKNTFFTGQHYCSFALQCRLKAKLLIKVHERKEPPSLSIYFCATRFW